MDVLANARILRNAVGCVNRLAFYMLAKAVNIC